VFAIPTAQGLQRLLVLFVSTSVKWLAGKNYSRDIFRVEGFFLQGLPYKDHIEELFIVMVLLYAFPTRNIVYFRVNFTFLTATYFSKTRCSLFVLKVPLNPNQSVNQVSAAMVKAMANHNPSGCGSWTVAMVTRYPENSFSDDRTPVLVMVRCSTQLDRQWRKPGTAESVPW